MTESGWVLAIETSAARGGVALGQAGRVIAEREFSADRRQSAEIALLIREVLAAGGIALADVSVVGFSGGPGSFTGLRIAATAAAMLQSVCGCRVVRVSSLEAIARNTVPLADCPPRIAVMVHAKRNEVAAALFERVSGGELRQVEPVSLRVPAGWLPTLQKPFAAVGEAVAEHRAVCEAVGAAIVPPELWPPRPRAVLEIGTRLAQRGEFCAPHEIVPIYARPPECEEVYERRRADAIRKREEADA